MKAVVKFKLPGLVTCQLGLKHPLSHPAQHHESPAEGIVENFNNRPSPCQKASLLPKKWTKREKKGSGLVLEGTDNDLADKLVTLLREKTGVLR